jgi:hypothetical protein
MGTLTWMAHQHSAASLLHCKDPASLCQVVRPLLCTHHALGAGPDEDLWAIQNDCYPQAGPGEAFVIPLQQLFLT